MFAIIGIVVVFGAIIAGYLMEKGNMLVLVQPAEFYGLPLGRVVVSLLTPPDTWQAGLERLPI